MGDDVEKESFDVGLVVYLRGREEPINILAGMRAPTDRSLYSAEWVTEMVEMCILEDWRDGSVGWLRFEGRNGDVTHLHKTDIQLIRILSLSEEEDAD